MRYDYRVVDLVKGIDHPTVKAAAQSDLGEASIRVLGEDGWDLVSVEGGKAYLKKAIPDSSPVGVAKVCVNCRSFGKSEERKDIDGVSVGWCAVTKIAMTPAGTCEQFCQRGAAAQPRIAEKAEAEPVAKASDAPAKAVPDEESAWHWQPKTEAGERRVEAITTQEDGVKAPQHKHRVVAILSREHAVVRGKTDSSNGHEHDIKLVGTAEEVDGHTHGWNLPGK